MDRVLRIVFLAGSDNHSTRLSIESVCRLPNVEVSAVVLDTGTVGFWRRFKNLRGNIRREGWGYLPERLIKGLRETTDGLVHRSVVADDQVERLLATAFPDRWTTMSELGKKYGFEVVKPGNLNQPAAIQALKSFDAELGIVLGTRILREHTFSVPRLGCINLHKGKVPEYRGLPPGFWELYDGASSAGVTVHFVDDGLDTGDIVAASEVPITDTETPESLREKLHQEGSRLLSVAVGAIQRGDMQRRKQPPTVARARTKPTTAQMRQLRKKLPHWGEPSDVSVLIRNIYALFVYYAGLYWVAREYHQLARSRGCILLYHRVNDFSLDVLTVDTRTFASHLIALARRYPPIATAALVRRVNEKKNIAPTSIAIHFDDCYQDVYVNGAPILKSAGWPAAAFVSSGFIGTTRSFAHDLQKYPFRFPNFKAEDLRAWIEQGFEIGAHTVNHVNLASCSIDESKYEVIESRRQLEAIIGEGKVAHFSFPFGRIDNIRREAKSIIEEAGYTALFSAHGGFVNLNTDVYDIPRIGTSGQTRALQLLLEVEGLSPNQMVIRFKMAVGRFRGTRAMSTPDGNSSS